MPSPTESGLYYLQSRYYDPEIGRFINSDVLAATGQSLLGNNMFVYCGNNPVKRADTSGTFWDTVLDVVVPFVGGLGEAAHVVNAALDAADMVDDAVDTAKVGWKVGDDITNLTKAGNAPSWSTVRQRYRKNEAFYNASQYSDDDLSRMTRGLAPQVELNGKLYSMELHHIQPRRCGGSNAYSNLLQVTPWEHAEIDAYRHFVP